MPQGLSKKRPPFERNERSSSSITPIQRRTIFKKLAGCSKGNFLTGDLGWGKSFDLLDLKKLFLVQGFPLFLKLLAQRLNMDRGFLRG